MIYELTDQHFNPCIITYHFITFHLTRRGQRKKSFKSNMKQFNQDHSFVYITFSVECIRSPCLSNMTFKAWYIMKYFHQFCQFCQFCHNCCLSWKIHSRDPFPIPEKQKTKNVFYWKYFCRRGLVRNACYFLTFSVSFIIFSWYHKGNWWWPKYDAFSCIKSDHPWSGILSGCVIHFYNTPL